MKVSTLFKAIGFGCLLCGSYIGHAQPLLYATHLVVQVSEVDRHHLYVHRERRHLAGRMSLFFKDLDKSKVQQLVQFAQVSCNPVWIMDGQKLLVQCVLAGQAEYGDADGNSKYGFLLSFSSTEDAEKACAILKLEPDAKEADSKQDK